MLHITNGKSAGQLIQETGITGILLTWDDVLHEGPTPAGLSLGQMSEVRARFIANYYTLPFEEVMADFVRRDTALTHFYQHEEVVMWFEHDLYDQLQLLQLLNWFAGQDLARTTLSLICINAFAGIDHFLGLGQLTPRQLASLFGTRQVVTPSMLQLGSHAWQAYCSANPRAVETVARTETRALPFLERALLRHLAEYPGVGDGLSHTERQLLEVIGAGAQQPATIFRAVMDKEENAFMGDMTCWVHLSQLCQGAKPLLVCADGSPFVLAERGEYHEEFLTQRIVLTEDGSAVVRGQGDWLILSGGIDRWLGGVHLEGQDAAWRWDRQSKFLVYRAER